MHLRSVYLYISGKEKTHKHKHICGLVPGLGGCQKFVYVFFQVIPYGAEKKKKHKQNPPKIPGQSREIFVYVFFLYVFVFAPKYLSLVRIAVFSKPFFCGTQHFRAYENGALKSANRQTLDRRHMSWLCVKSPHV